MNSERCRRLFGEPSQESAATSELASLQRLLDRLPDQDALKLHRIVRRSLADIVGLSPSEFWCVVREVVRDVERAAQMTLRLEAAKSRIEARRQLGWA